MFPAVGFVINQVEDTLEDKLDFREHSSIGRVNVDKLFPMILSDLAQSGRGFAHTFVDFRSCLLNILILLRC